jgi:hypothetical protein
MTVAATIEVGTGGRSGTGQGMALARTPGRAPDRAGSGAADRVSGTGSEAAGAGSRAAAAGTQSFRSSWQTQMASLDKAAESGGLEDAADGAQDSSQGSKAAVTSGSTLPAVRASTQQSAMAAMAAQNSPLPGAGSVAGRASLPQGRSTIGTSATQLDRTATASVDRGATAQASSKRNESEKAKAASHTGKSEGTATAPGQTALLAATPIPVLGITVAPAPAAQADLSRPTVAAQTSAGINAGSTGSAGSGGLELWSGSVGNQTAGIAQGTGAHRSGGSAQGQAEGPDSKVTAEPSRSAAEASAESAGASAAKSPPAAVPEVHRAQAAVSGGDSRDGGVALADGKPDASSGSPEAVAGETVTGTGGGHAEAVAGASDREGQAETTSAVPVAAPQTQLAIPAQDQSSLAAPIVSYGSEVSLTQNTSLANGSSAASQGTQRGTRVSGTAEHRTAAVPVQAAGVSLDAGGDAGGLVRDPAGTQAATSLPDGTRGASASAAPREAFAELDSGPGAVTWTHAAPRQAEAGFQDPTLGWVSVRADMVGGGVHAALVPGSAEAAQELGRQMDGLHTYLAEQRTPVESLSMASPSGRGGDFSGGRGQPTEQNTQGQGAGQESSGQQASSDREQVTAVRGMGIDRTATIRDSSAITGMDRMASLEVSGGSHISVVA